MAEMAEPPAPPDPVSEIVAQRMNEARSEPGSPILHGFGAASRVMLWTPLAMGGPAIVSIIVLGGIGYALDLNMALLVFAIGLATGFGFVALGSTGEVVGFAQDGSIVTGKKRNATQIDLHDTIGPHEPIVLESSPPGWRNPALDLGGERRYVAGSEDLELIANLIEWRSTGAPPFRRVDS